MSFPSKPHQFKPGQSGNPAGSSRRQRITGAILEAFDDAKFAAVGMRLALEGDFRFWSYIFDRVDGPLAQPEPPIDPETIAREAQLRAKRRKRTRRTDRPSS